MAKSVAGAFVFPITEQVEDITKLERLIKQACRLVCEQADPSDCKKCLHQAEVLVILICPQTMNNPVVDDLIMAASTAGKRVVGVWSSESKGEELPPCINKYGEGAIPLDAKAVAKVICGGESIWLTPTGVPRTTPKTPRHHG